MNPAEDNAVVLNFIELRLPRPLTTALRSLGLVYASHLQQRMIREVMAGSHIILQAPRCSGKITSLCIALTLKINSVDPQCQALIAVPRWEIAYEISLLLRAFRQPVRCSGSAHSRLEYQRGDHIVVGTPDGIQRSMRPDLLSVSSVKVFALVEAQELLRGGFKEEIDIIRRGLPKDVQVITLSPPLHDDVLAIAQEFIPNHTRIFSITKHRLGVFKHFFVKSSMKMTTFCDIVDQLRSLQAIVFCNTRRHADEVLSCAQQFGMAFAALTQGDNYAGLRTFIEGRVKLLITTDVFPQCTLLNIDTVLINYDLPVRMKDYVCRACSCKYDSYIVNLVTDEDSPQLRHIETFFDITIRELYSDAS